MHTRFILAAVLFVSPASFCFFAQRADAGEVIGTFGAPRVTDADLSLSSGTVASDAHNALVANFPEATFVTSPTLTPSFLSGINVLMITSAMSSTEPLSPLSSSEETALFNFVKGGGNAFLIMEGFSPFISAVNSIVNPFGMTIVDDGLTGVLQVTPVGPSNPIINGPFGDFRRSRCMAPAIS